VFTLLNLISGGIALFYAFEKPEDLYYAAIFVFIAIFFDFFDGFIARLTNSVSEVGKQLDSLADLVSFAAAPAAITFQMLKSAMEIKQFSFDLPYTDILILFAPILLLVAAALRLAKFNVDPRQDTKFIGLAVPVSAIYFASLPLVNDFNPDDLLVLKVWMDIDMPFKFIMAVIGMQVYVLTNVWVYLISILVLAVLQLIEVPFFSLKFEGFGFKKNAARYIFLIIALILFILLQFFIVPFIVIIYILVSVSDDIVALFTKKT
jgi:CDP-diacylglycerol--serine O-phosphatidyltransferase